MKCSFYVFARFDNEKKGLRVTMRNRNMNRILSLLLCLIMCLSLLPTSAFAESEFAEEQADFILEEEATEELGEEPAEEPSEEPAEEPGEEPAEEPSEEPAEDDDKLPDEEAIEDEAALAGGDRVIAGTLTVGATVTAEITEAGQVIYYRFVPNMDGVYCVYSSVDHDDTYGYLYDASWNEIAANDDGGDGTNFLITASLTAGDTYYVGVRYYNMSYMVGSIPVTLEQIEAGWKTIAGQTYYFDEDGNKAYGIWTIDGKQYGFNTGDGALVRNNVTWDYDDEWNQNFYFCDENGLVVVQPGWQKDDYGNWYYIKDTTGKLVTNDWKQSGSVWYYFNSEGRMVANGGYRARDGKLYYFRDTGALDETAGWKKNTYGEWFFVENGQCVTGWKQISNVWYYFDDYDGRMYANGVYTIDDKEYFFDASGHLVSTPGWKKATNTYTWTDGNGVQHTETEEYWYYLGNDNLPLKGWQKIDNKWYYFEESSGRMYANDVYEIDGKKYCFEASGAMGTGWTKRTGTYTDNSGNKQTWTEWYYADGNGVLKTGWQQISNKWYYFDTSWCYMYRDGSYEIGGKKYYFDTNGAMGTGWIKRTGTYTDGSGKERTWTNWYYADGNGVLQTGWQKINNKWYYFDQWGWMYQDGTWEIDGKRYHFDENGAMGTGWIKDTYTYTSSGGTESTRTTWYYADSNGVLQTGWQRINGQWYYFNEWGSMCSNGIYQINDKLYFFTESGALAGAGWQKFTNNYNGTNRTYWYYTDANGVVQTGWQKISGKWYYFNYAMLADGLYMIDGQYEYFNSSGEWVQISSSSAWRRVGNAMRYVENGKYVTGWKKIGNEYYYFASNGDMQTGWRKSGNTWYYCNPHMYTDGAYRIDGKFYYFDRSGAMKTGPWIKNEYTVNGSKYVTWYYANSDGTLVEGWKEINGKTYYFRPAMVANGVYEIDGTQYSFDASGALRGVWGEG